MGKRRACLFESQSSLQSAIYLWTPSPNQVYRIDHTDGLPEILAVLDDPSRKLNLTPLNFLRGISLYKLPEDEFLGDWFRLEKSNVCGSMPWKEPGQRRLTSFLRHKEILKFLVEAGEVSRPHFYLWNPHSKGIYLVPAPEGLDGIFHVQKNVGEEFRRRKVRRTIL